MIDLFVFMRSCAARGVDFAAAAAALADATRERELDALPLPAAVGPGAAPGTSSSSPAAMAQASVPATRERRPVPNMGTSVAQPERIPNAFKLAKYATTSFEPDGSTWRDSSGTWFDRRVHAWNRAGYPAVTPAGKFRAKRSSSSSSSAGDPVGDQARAENVRIDLLDLSTRIKAATSLEALEALENELAAQHGGMSTGSDEARKAYRDLEFEIDARKEELDATAGGDLERAPGARDEETAEEASHRLGYQS